MHSDSALGQHGFQRPRDRPANQGHDPQLGEARGALFWVGVGQRAFAAAPLEAIDEFHHEQLPGHVEHRRNPALPDWYGDAHACQDCICRAGLRW